MSEQERKTSRRKTDPNVIRSLVKRGRLGLRLLGDPRVPLWAKSLAPLSLLYLISPIDLIPEGLLIALGPLVAVGAVDDLAVILILLNLFINLAPPGVVAEHERELAGEGDWQVAEEEDAPGAASDEPPPMVEGFYRIADEDDSQS